MAAMFWKNGRKYSYQTVGCVQMEIWPKNFECFSPSHNHKGGIYTF